MEKEHLATPKETAAEELQKEFLMQIIRKSFLANYVPDAFKEIITDIAIELKKVQTIDGIFEKAGEFDTFMGNKGNKYEQIVRKAHANYSKFSPADSATLKYLKMNMAFDLAKGKLYKEAEQKNTFVPSNAIIASAKFCVNLTTELDRTIVPNPRYL